jgi:hypothetical protein
MIKKKIADLLGILGRTISLIILHLNINPNLRFEYKNKFLNVYQKFTYEEQQDSYNFFKKYFYKSTFCVNYHIKDAALEIALKNHTNNDLYLEFGVYKGHSINSFSKILEKFDKSITVHGFDSFEGLSHDWLAHRQTKGAYDLKGKIPGAKSNVNFVKGMVENTLPKFLEEHQDKINFIHFDMDIYEPTKIALSLMKSRLKKGCIILLAQCYNYSGWREGEFKALTEVLSENEYKYKMFASNGSQVVIEII